MSTQSRTLLIAIRVEPASLSFKGVHQGQTTFTTVRSLFNANLALIDDAGTPRPALAEHRLTVYLSLNYLAEAQLEVGSRLPLRVIPERMRIFE